MKINGDIQIQDTGTSLNTIANGIIIENGSNSSGYYIKYSNGIMIQYGTQSFSLSFHTYWTYFTASNSFTITYPLTFNSIYSCDITPNNTAQSWICGDYDGDKTTLNSSKCFLVSPLGIGTRTITASINYIAIGTWK